MARPYNILLISPFFYPEPISTGKYNTLLAEALVSQRHHVEVIASHPLYPDWKPVITDETTGGIVVHRGGGSMRYPSRPVFRRAVLELWFAMHAYRKLSAMKRKGVAPDVVLPVFPPSLFFLASLHVLPAKTRKVAVVHDLQGVYASSKRGLLASLLGKAIRYVERRAFSGCDRLIFLSDEMMRTAMDQYHLDPGRCEVVYPPASLEPASANAGSDLADLFPPGFFHVVYSGALGDKQDPEALVRIFCSAGESVIKTMFHIFSRGPGFERLKEKYEAKAMNVLFHDLVPESQLPELYLRSDVQVIPQRTGTSGGSLPSKLPNLLAAGVRILAISDEGSELERLLSGVEGAIVVTSWESQKFVVGLVAAMGDMRTHDERRTINQAVLNRYFSLDRLVGAVLQG